MGSEEDVCEAYPELLIYSMRMEWIGLDGKTYLNSSVRVEWSENDSRAVCEVPKKLSVRTAQDYTLPQDAEASGHCVRCLVQVLAFVALVVLFLRGLGVQTLRTVTFPPPKCGDLSVESWNRESPKRWAKPPERRTRSAAAVLERSLYRPLLATARWADLSMVWKSCF